VDAIGLISGTSMDGIDAALVRLRVEPARVDIATLDFISVPYPSDLIDPLRRAAAGSPLPAGELGWLHAAVGEAFAGAALDLLKRPAARGARPGAIGSHGQTVAHDPGRGVSVQLGSAAVIAERTGLPVVSDFRARDLAAGGQGAPLVPFLDQLLFADRVHRVAALNLGGIANVTLLEPGAEPGSVRAFDTGPANMVVDGLVRRLSGGRETCDRDGARARRGRPHAALLAQLLEHPYFARRPPKSTGAETFGEAYVDELLAAGTRDRIGEDDLIATAIQLTVESVARALADAKISRLVVAGGGVHNPALMDGLRRAFHGAEVCTSDRFGVNPDAKEAVAFAVLAWAHLEGRTAGLPRVTGARRATVLGSLVPGTP
jgi:anhydro-N-acetylmuramic acid kinase